MLLASANKLLNALGQQLSKLERFAFVSVIVQSFCFEHISKVLTYLKGLHKNTNKSTHSLRKEYCKHILNLWDLVHMEMVGHEWFIFLNAPVYVNSLLIV
jgi:hypothetical protein